MLGEDRSQHTPENQWLFWTCFVALVATAFGFIVRTQVIDDWAVDFNLTETQKGELFGVGLWPFAISIVLFSLIIDRIGYGRALVFALVCHILSAVLTIFAEGYWSLYIGTFVVAIGNGTVEAVINPVIVTVFSKQKTKWLNILHAGWPGGLVLGGVLAISMGDLHWKFKVGLILLPAVIYGLMMLRARFPVSERVAAGVSYRDMLREFGIVGALIVSSLIVFEVGRVFDWSMTVKIACIVAATVLFGYYARSMGRPLFIIMLLLMIPLATTELGTDSWITSLMTPAMAQFGVAAGWVLVYTSAIMMVLRFFAGPIVHKLSPLGLLAVCSALAATGLVLLSQVEAALMILLAATVYGIGKTFFWPTMLGVVAEQSPRGGALTLNATGGVGMLGVGVVGAVFLGFIQDTSVEQQLLESHPQIHSEVVESKRWVLGRYDAVVPGKVTPDIAEDVAGATAIAKKEALSTVAIFPLIMLVCYLLLIFYFRSRGGYRTVDIGDDTS
jgi:MFS family permease